MKENEAPEKIYRTTTYLNSNRGNTKWKEKPVAGAENIEYTQTDALIEKIEEWLIEHSEDVDYTWYDEIEHASGITNKFIEDLLNYIREE